MTLPAVSANDANEEAQVAQLSKADFARLMEYPEARIEWEMYRDDLFQAQITDYEPGSESAPEHYRYGAFRWWLAKDLSQAEIGKYIALTFLDPNQGIANSARSDLLAKHTLTPEIRELLLLRVPLRSVTC